MTTAESGLATNYRPAGSPWPLSDAAKYLGVSHRHLVRLIDAGKVKSIRLGRRVLIADTEVQRIANEGIQ